MSEGKALRQRADDAFRCGSAGLMDQLNVTSPDALHLALHELRAHQIELEMQNEDLRRTQDALYTSQAHYSNLYDMAPVGYFTIGESGLIEQANLTAAALLGVDRIALAKQKITRFIFPDDQDILYLMRKGITGTRQPQSCELRCVRQDGTPFWAHLDAIAVQNDSGSLSLRIVLTDINERKQAEASLLLANAQAEKANHARSRFLAAASHDLRQPAHALGMFMDRLDQLSIDPQSKALVASANAAVREMQDMLDDMFDLSRLDVESTQTQIQSFPVSVQFDALQRGLANEANAKGLRFRIRPSSAWLQTDSTLLRRILINLVNNSIRYTRAGSILVACRPTHSGTHARIEVWDSGLGIAPEDQEKVFQEFYQVANPQRDRRLGLGVGLSIVERCCRLLRLPLSLRSALGEGTRVTVMVPLAKADPEMRDEDVLLSCVPSEIVDRQVMVIEDDVMGRGALAGLLESWGYVVSAVEGAKMAAERFQKDEPPDMIISDLRLGDGINGIEVVRMLRSLAGQKIPACVISGDTDDQVRQQVEAAGLILLSKPVRPAKLRSVLRNLTL